MMSTLAPDPALVLVGAGKMGGALLDGWLAAGIADGAAIIDPAPSPALVSLCARAGLSLNKAPPRPAETLVLAVKPQMLDAVAASVAPLVGPDTLIVSVLAGKRIADLRARLPGAGPIIRAMPNLPAEVGRGVTGAFASAEVEHAGRARAETLLGAVGLVEWLEDEALIDAVTAVSGSGPAYVFHLVECLAAAGAAAGLPPDLAMRLARGTVTGAGELLHRSEAEAGALRQAVTSPGGTTAAALDVLMMADGLKPLMTRAVLAARRRAEELSG